MHNASNLKRIRLTLARSKEFPEGSSQFGYEFIAPIDQRGHIDAAAWRSGRSNCTVRRFAADKDDRTGMLVHKAGGPHGRWIFDYDAAQESDDEPGFHFESHSFVPGEYVSIRDENGTTHTFSVVSVKPLSSS